MVEMTKYTSKKVEADNIVTVNGAKWELNDKTTKAILALIEESMGVNSKPKKASDSEKFKVKNDKTIEFNVVKANNKYYAVPSQHLGKKVFNAMRNKVGIEYEKGLGFGFKKKADADAFAKAKVVVTAEEANAIKMVWEQ